MKRKDFLSAIMAVGTGISVGWRGRHEPVPEAAARMPPYLKGGDTIGITSPAGYIKREEIEPSVRLLQSWGFRTRIGETIGKRDFSFGGTDAERRRDLQQMLDDASVAAILCARGGYGAVRIVDELDFTRFAENPKWIIGFSDVTVLHCHLNHHFGIASLHSKMCNSFPEKWEKAEPVQVETILSIRRALTGGTMRYNITPDIRNRRGLAEGQLIGGNLKIIETLAGTNSDIQTAGKILFVEDTGEFPYSIDRMFWNLKRTGKLAPLKGLIVGGFRTKVEEPGDEFGRSIYDIVLEKVADYKFPVCFNFPVGHQTNNYALKCGVRHRLEVNAVSTSLQEIR